MKPLPAFFLGIVFTVVVGAAIGLVAVENGLVPANADAKPPALERWAAQTSLRATLNRAAAAAPSPPPATAPDLLAAVKLYAENCIVCHGTSTSVQTNIAVGVYQKPPRFGRPHAFDEGDLAGGLYWEIAHGVRYTAMPAFGNRLSDAQIWQLTNLLKSLDTLPPAVATAWRSLQQPPGLTTATPAPQQRKLQD
jgi:thiosulfate dehydrogenase